MGGLILGSAALGRVTSEPSETFRDCGIFWYSSWVKCFGGSGFGCSWVCAVAIGQDRANTLHNYAMKEWAAPAKLNTCSGTGMILQTPVSQTLNSWLCYLCLRNNFNHNLLLSFPQTCAIQQHLYGESYLCSGIWHGLIQNSCSLLQKLFPAPHSHVAAGFSSHHVPVGSLHHSAPSFWVPECSVWIWP